MAGIVVSVTMGVMKPILDKLGVLMGDEYKKLKGLRKKVSFLERELRAINALLEKMDASEELDPQAKNWRKDIIEMSYDIEDFINDFMDHVGESRDKERILQKACHYLGTFKDRRRLGNQFQEIRALVIEVSERRIRYKLDECISNTSHVSVDPRLSALFKDSESLVGMKSQKEELVKWVTDEGQQLKVMSIVGFGGLGKTTLANEVYLEVGAWFNFKAFVSVSSKPDMMRLLNSILSKLEKQDQKSSHVCEMDIINKIRNHLHNKRYFIVVDDLWGIPEWNNVISCAFPKNDRHSRIIITTRNDDVAVACSSYNETIHRMEPLSEQDSRKLFCNRIFGSEENCPPHFQDLSCEILKKCGGLPLAIITVASILACQPTRLKEQWKYIQNSLGSKSATRSTLEDMMDILELSYKNLPNNLKACFLYLGIYPEDYMISKAELVRQWVAEGFVSRSLGRDVLDVAESYFNELANRSMIQPAFGGHNNTGMSHCRVHDMMLELILRKCRENNFLSLINDLQMMAEGQDKVIHRLTIDLNGVKDGTLDMTTMMHLSKVRSLYVFGGSNWIPPMLEFKLVRSLFLDILGRKETMDLTVINQLSQLRYLNVKNDGLYSYDDPWKLLLGHIRSRHLETLELHLSDKCCVVSEFADLPHLSHLVVKGKLGLPEGIGTVKSLRSLDGFYLPKSSLDNIEGLGQLTNLTDLSFCSGFWSYPAPQQEWIAAFSSSLEKLGNLKCLVVDQNYKGMYADALSNWVSAPFRDLQRLHLRNWTFSRVPRWIGDLHDLCELSLAVKQIREEDVSVIGRLPSLVQLYLHVTFDFECNNNYDPGRIVIGGSTGFKLLERFDIKFGWMSRLTFEAGAMPSLVKLRVILDTDNWDGRTPLGVQHLSSLKEIHVRIYVGWKVGRMIREAFRGLADALPGRPALEMHES